MPNGRVLTSEEFLGQIKEKEERIQKETQEKEDRKRKKEEALELKKSCGRIKNPKVNYLP